MTEHFAEVPTAAEPAPVDTGLIEALLARQIERCHRLCEHACAEVEAAEPGAGRHEAIRVADRLMRTFQALVNALVRLRRSAGGNATELAAAASHAAATLERSRQAMTEAEQPRNRAERRRLAALQKKQARAG